jgi:hypothetical protein
MRAWRTSGSVGVATRGRPSDWYDSGQRPEPDVLPAVPSREKKPRHKVSASHTDGNPIARAGGACQPHGGRERGWSGRAHPGAVRGNVVSPPQPKRLRGWNHKGRGQVQGVPHALAPRACHRRTRPASPTRSRGRNVGSPHVFRTGKRTGRGAERRGGLGGWRKRPPRWHGAERGSMPHAQAGCRPSGVSSRERRTTRLRTHSRGRR